MAIDSGGGGAKKPRVDEQGDRSEAVDADVDRISALPDELRQRILTRLSFKDAICTGTLTRGWRDLWRSRWAHRSSVEIHIHSNDALRRELDALARELRPRRRLDRFSLVADSRKLKSLELLRFIEYSAECRVEDLHVDLRKTAYDSAFRLPLCSPLLMRLSLRRICIANRPFYKGTQPFRALEVIQLQTVSIYRPAFHKMMSLCPSLLTLYLRDCICGPDLVMSPNLRNVTMANCAGRLSLLDWRSVPNLQLLPLQRRRRHLQSAQQHCQNALLPST
ncbi:unnamed protein product [Urochloa humidicola]